MKRIRLLALLASVLFLLLPACEAGGGGGGAPVYHRPSTGKGSR